MWPRNVSLELQPYANVRLRAQKHQVCTLGKLRMQSSEGAFDKKGHVSEIPFRAKFQFLGPRYGRKGCRN